MDKGRPPRRSVVHERHELRLKATGYCTRCTATVGRSKLVGGELPATGSVFGDLCFRSVCKDRKLCDKRILGHARKEEARAGAAKDGCLQHIHLCERSAEESEQLAEKAEAATLWESAADLYLRAAEDWLRSAASCRRFQRSYAPPTRRAHLLRCAASRADRGRAAARRAEVAFREAAKLHAPAELRALRGGGERTDGPAPRLALVPPRKETP